VHFKEENGSLVAELNCEVEHCNLDYEDGFQVSFCSLQEVGYDCACQTLLFLWQFLFRDLLQNVLVVRAETFGHVVEQAGCSQMVQGYAAA